MKPLVSIIIPIYNVEQYIRDSLDSALEQTYTNIEYILVDDCGNDNSIKIVNEIIDHRKDKDIKLIHHKENQGLSEARNTGLKAAKGSYVFFMDSDDLISNDCIDLHVNAITKYNADFSDGNVEMIGTKHSNFNSYDNLDVIKDGALVYKYFEGLHISSWNKLIKKSFLNKNEIRFKKGMLYEDILWVFQICSKATSCVLIPQYTYKYVIRPGSITTQKSDPTHSRNQLNSFLDLFYNITQEFSRYKEDKIKHLQKKWYNKKLLIVKGRILNSALNYSEKSSFNKKLKPFVKFSSGVMKYILSLPFPIFYFLFFLPNKILRKIR